MAKNRQKKHEATAPVFDRQEYEAREKKSGIGSARDLVDLDFEMQAARNAWRREPSASGGRSGS